MSNSVFVNAERNGFATKGARKAKAATSPGIGRSRVSARRSRELKQLRRWSHAGVVMMSGLSALLNGYANAQVASVPWAGWGMGLVVPAIVLVLGKVGSLLWRRGWRRGAQAIGAVGAGLLFLSVLHCATSIGLLTGSSLWLALPMAVAIDCGLVGCEIAALWSHEE